MGLKEIKHLEELKEKSIKVSGQYREIYESMRNKAASTIPEIFKTYFEKNGFTVTQSKLDFSAKFKEFKVNLTLPTHELRTFQLTSEPLPKHEFNILVTTPDNKPGVRVEISVGTGDNVDPIKKEIEKITKDITNAETALANANNNKFIFLVTTRQQARVQDRHSKNEEIFDNFEDFLTKYFND